jgi:hypothetical protein
MKTRIHVRLGNDKRMAAGVRFRYRLAGVSTQTDQTIKQMESFEKIKFSFTAKVTKKQKDIVLKRWKHKL